MSGDGNNTHMKLKFIKRLYFGDYAFERRSSIVGKLKRGRYCPGVYVICPASSEKDLLDMIPSHMLFRTYGGERLVLGVAYSKEEAFEVCRDIVLDVYSHTGGYDVRSYFADRTV